MKLNEKPFELLGFTSNDYIIWCKKYNLKPYLRTSKQLFFKKIHNFELVKRNNELIEYNKKGGK